MHVYEIRDPDQARRHLLDGLLMTRTGPVDAGALRHALQWAMEIAGSGDPLPPVGAVLDIGRIALGMEHEQGRRDALPVAPGVDHRLVRRYDDYVLGKLYADLSFERGADALLRYQGRDRVRGLAFLVEQFRQRAGFGGALLSPAVIKALLGEPDDTLLAASWDAIEQAGPAPQLLTDYDELIDAIHNLGEALGAEDIFELEHGTALAEFGQRVALRQIIRAAEEFEQALPKHKIRPAAVRRQVATNLLDEDAYPVGGFTSISNRGSIESLLHSQLAFMERDERPDLFDIKFLRDELLYYSRDENQFLRRRQSFVFALYPDLTLARFKDAALLWQRIILVLGLLVAAVAKLTDWLSDDALSFEFLILDPKQLAGEEELLRTLFREQMAAGVVAIEHAAPNAVARRCQQYARRSLCNCLVVSTKRHSLEAAPASVAELIPSGPVPQVTIDDAVVPEPENATPIEAWQESLLRLLQTWIR